MAGTAARTENLARPRERRLRQRRRRTDVQSRAESLRPIFPRRQQSAGDLSFSWADAFADRSAAAARVAVRKAGGRLARNFRLGTAPSRSRAAMHPEPDLSELFRADLANLDSAQLQAETDAIATAVFLAEDDDQRRKDWPILLSTLESEIETRVAARLKSLCDQELSLPATDSAG